MLDNKGVKTWCWLLKLLVLLQTLISASSGPLGTGCIWRSSISPDLPEEQEISPRVECSEGHLYWYYPKGTLKVVFQHEFGVKNFDLCVDLSNEVDIDELLHVTGVESYNSVYQDHTCLQSQNGEVVLKFVRNKDKLNIPRLNIIKYFRVENT